MAGGMRGGGSESRSQFRVLPYPKVAGINSGYAMQCLWARLETRSRDTGTDPDVTLGKNLSPWSRTPCRRFLRFSTALMFKPWP